MSKLTEKEILDFYFKKAVNKEAHREAKYAFLARTVNNRRLQELFGVFTEASRSHQALCKIEMKNLNIE